MIKGAIFDIDGTVLESMWMWYTAGERYLAALGIEAEEGLGDTLFSMSLPEGARYVWERYNLETLGVTEEDVRTGVRKPVFDFYATEAQLKPGARELFVALHEAGIPITIASSTDKNQIDIAMERLDMAKYIDRVYSVTDVGVNKSNPLIFNLAAEFMGTKPEETWVFEDGLYAIKCAKNAGYKTVGFYDKVSDKDWDEIQATATIAALDCSHITLEDIQKYGE